MFNRGGLSVRVGSALLSLIDTASPTAILNSLFPSAVFILLLVRLRQKAVPVMCSVCVCLFVWVGVCVHGRARNPEYMCSVVCVRA